MRGFRAADEFDEAHEARRDGLAKVVQDLDRERKKLSNAKFVESAPAEIVAEVRTRIANSEREVAEVEQQEQAVSALVAQRRA